MSLIVTPESFTHILRVLNTNLDGKRKVPFALRQIRGVGRRFAFIACRKADIDVTKRAGEMTPEQIENVVKVLQNPRDYKIPDYLLNRQRDMKDGTTFQAISNGVDQLLRDDLERMRKIRVHRGLRHMWGLRVRGQHSKTTGRRGKTVGVAGK